MTNDNDARGALTFRKKPVTISAIQWTGENGDDVQAFLHNGREYAADGWVKGSYVEIGTLEGLMVASIGDWIIRGVKGEHYPCKPDIFAQTYEPADSLPAGDGLTARIREAIARGLGASRIDEHYDTDPIVDDIARRIADVIDAPAASPAEFMTTAELEEIARENAIHAAIDRLLHSDDLMDGISAVRAMLTNPPAAPRQPGEMGAGVPIDVTKVPGYVTPAQSSETAASHAKLGIPQDPCDCSACVKMRGHLYGDLPACRPGRWRDGDPCEPATSTQQDNEPRCDVCGAKTTDPWLDHRGCQQLASAQQEMGAGVPYKDSTPQLRVGDSSFESWYEQKCAVGWSGQKQLARDAYAAGMGDPLVVARHDDGMEKMLGEWIAEWFPDRRYQSEYFARSFFVQMRHDADNDRSTQQIHASAQQDEREALIDVLLNEQNNLAASRRQCGQHEGMRWDAMQRVIDYLSSAQQVQADAGAVAIYQVQAQDGNWFDTTERHYAARVSGKFSGAARIVYAHPSPAEKGKA